MIGCAGGYHWYPGFDDRTLKSPQQFRIADGDGGHGGRVLPAGQHLAHHAGGDGCVRYGVDQDKAAGQTIVEIGVEKQRARGLNVHNADAVEFQGGGRLAIQRLHVHAMLMAVILAFTVCDVCFSR